MGKLESINVRLSPMQLKGLAELQRRTGMDRTNLIRDAVQDYLEAKNAFGPRKSAELRDRD